MLFLNTSHSVPTFNLLSLNFKLPHCIAHACTTCTVLFPSIIIMKLSKYRYATMSTTSLLLTSRAASSFLGTGASRICAAQNSCLPLPARQSRLFSSRATGSKRKVKRLFPEELNIIYDSKCNVCKLEIDFLRRRDEKLTRKRVSQGFPHQTKLLFTDLESDAYSSRDPRNGGVDYEKGMASMHAVTPEGQVINGVPVFRRAYEQVNLGWLFAVTRIPLVKTIADKAYNLFARYRTRITRGQTVESLVEAYREKKALEKNQEAADCEVCQERPQK